MSETTERKKPTLGGLLRDASREFSGLDQGVPYTFKCLLTAPGATVRRYLDEPDGRLTRPLRLFVVVLLLYFAAASLGGVNDVNEQAWQQILQPYGLGASAFTAFLARYQTALFALTLPLMMLATRVAWPRSGRTLAEHLIFNTYLFSVQLLILIPLTMMIAVLSWSGIYSNDILLHGIVAPAIPYGYAVWMAVSFFPGSRIWSAIRALIIQLGVAYIYWFIVLAVFVIVANLTGATSSPTV